MNEETPIIDGSDKVSIPIKEYETLLNDSAFLSCLHAAGVDNWEGYSEAQGMMEGD